MENQNDPTNEERDEAIPTQEAEPGHAVAEELRQTVEAQARRIDELARAYAEVLNDRDSYRRRLERENERQLATAKGEMAEGLLDAAEDLRRALESGSEDAKALSEGVRLIADGFMRRLEQMGLARIDTEGKAFDPLLHEAVDLVPSDDRDQDGMVVDEARAGWRMGEKILRAARVRVARYLPPPAGQEGGNTP